MSFNYDLQLLSTAAHFNLKHGAERRRSVNELINLFYLLLDGLAPSFCLEVGAFDAKFSQRMVKTGIKCYAFEANPYNYQRFKEELDLPNLNYIHTAISNHIGNIDFMIQRTINGVHVDPVGGNNSIKSRVVSGIDYERVEVPCTTLEHFLNLELLSDKKYAMWIDVEGAASEVLTASTNSLENCQAVFIEVEESEFWGDQWLAWDISKFFLENGYVPIARDFETHKQYNVIYIKSHLLMSNSVVRSSLSTYFTRIGKQWL